MCPFRTVSFRLTPEEAERLDKLCEKTWQSRSKFALRATMASLVAAEKELKQRKKKH
jgi:predicted transcriptional regulator